MSKFFKPLSQSAYDPRWFIWTIVFLVVVGVSLVSYMFTLSTKDAGQDIVFLKTRVKAAALKH